MSYAAIDWAMPKVIKDVNAKSCLVVLAYHHNKETGLCCPSISTIADEMGVRSLNTVRKAIGVLVEMNLLTMSREFGDRGEILRGVSGFLCLGRLFQGQPNEAALCI